MTAPIRIAMLSGPRNISTTIMRSFESRADTNVKDEPFYACYLTKSGAKHPLREQILFSQATEWSEVSQSLQAPLPAGIQYSFEKHIAFHFTFAPALDWLDGARVFHLIRNPVEMIASYKNKLDDVEPIIDSYKIQRKLCEESPAPIVDATDILRAPEKMLRKLCASLQIEFSDAMLSWPVGPRESDGVWAPHWYDAVLASTGFKPYQEKEIKLSRELLEMADRCMDDYNFFYARRLLP